MLCRLFSCFMVLSEISQILPRTDHMVDLRLNITSLLDYIFYNPQFLNLYLVTSSHLSLPWNSVYRALSFISCSLVGMIGWRSTSETAVFIGL